MFSTKKLNSTDTKCPTRPSAPPGRPPAAPGPSSRQLRVSVGALDDNIRTTPNKRLSTALNSNFNLFKALRLVRAEKIRTARSQKVFPDDSGCCSSEKNDILVSRTFPDVENLSEMVNLFPERAPQSLPRYKPASDNANRPPLSCDSSLAQRNIPSSKTLISSLHSVGRFHLFSKDVTIFIPKYYSLINVFGEFSQSSSVDRMFNTLNSKPSSDDLEASAPSTIIKGQSELRSVNNLNYPYNLLNLMNSEINQRGEFVNKSILLEKDKKKPFVANFNCFNKFKQVFCRKKIINSNVSLDKALLCNNDHCDDKSVNLYEILKAQNFKMSFPIKKETENLLFVASKNISKFLLGPPNPEDKNKKCCVIDLDETLVHSSFKPLPRYDFKVSVDIEGNHYDIFIIKRPYVDLFLTKMGKLFECVLFTASLAKYAIPVANSLDKGNVFKWRLFREACVFYRGGFVKDLSMLGRSIDQTVILDNSPMSFLFNTKNAIHVISWFDDPDDKALLDLIPFCERLANSASVLNFLHLEHPPQTAAWPIPSSLTLIAPLMPSKQSSNETLPFLTELSPISNITSALIPNKKSASNYNRYYSERIKTQNISPSIRTFFNKTLGSKLLNDNSKSPNPSTSDNRKLKLEPSDNFKNAISRSSVSNIPLSPKLSFKAATIQGATSSEINVNEALKIGPQVVYLKDDIK